MQKGTAFPAQSSRNMILGGGLVLAVYLLTAWGAYQVFTTQVPSGNDFFSRWMGARALLLEGKDPYSEEVTLQIQIAMFGRPRPAEKDQVAFAYPLYAIFTFLPLVPLPYAQAQALWMSLLVYLTIGAGIITLRTIRVDLRRGELLALSLGTLFFYPVGRGIILGQFAILVLFSLTLAWWAIARGKDGIAGASLALSTIKPQMIVFILPFIMVWALVQKRWWIVLSFGLSLLALFGVSAFFLPDWLPKFLRAVANYQSYTAYYTGNLSPIGQGLSALLPGLDYWPTIVLTLALATYTLLFCYRALKDGEPALWPALGMTSVATLLLPVQTGSTNQVLLLWPLLFWVMGWRGHGKFNSAMASLLAAFFVVFPWILFFSTVAGDKENPVMGLPIPLFALIAFSLPWPPALPSPSRTRNDG